MSSAKNKANKSTFAAISLMAEILKLHHAVELAETQGPDALARYFQRLDGEALSRSGSKASRRIMQDPSFRQVVEALHSLKVEHPKPAAVLRILQEQIAAEATVSHHGLYQLSRHCHISSPVLERGYCHSSCAIRGSVQPRE